MTTATYRTLARLREVQRDLSRRPCRAHERGAPQTCYRGAGLIPFSELPDDTSGFCAECLAAFHVDAAIAGLDRIAAKETADALGPRNGGRS